MRKSSESFAGLPLQANGFLRRQNRSLSRNKNKNRGMTLLELLIVVSLLGIVALASVSLIVDTGEWKQQEVTEDKWLSIKRAIVGDDIVDITGRRDYSGFATDMGRLPNCLRELIRPYDCEAVLPDDQSVPERKLRIYSQNIDSHQWSGWRGPYLGIPGANEYRDGWGNTGSNNGTGNDDALNYGWLFGTVAADVNEGDDCDDADVEVAQRQPGAIIVQSCGDGGKVGNSTPDDFPNDYPNVALGGEYIPSVTRHDYQVDMGAGWNEVPVKIKSTGIVGQSRVIPANDLRLRLNYPIANGSIPDWSDLFIDTSVERDGTPFLSVTFPVSATRFVDGAGKVYTGDDTDTLTNTPPVAKDLDFVPSATVLSSTAFSTLVEIPDAASSALTFDDGSVLMLQDCPCQLQVEPPIKMSGVLVADGESINDSDNTVAIVVPPEKIAPITADLGKYIIELPQVAKLDNPRLVYLAPPAAGRTLTFNADVEDSYFPKLVSAVPFTVTVSEGFDVEGDLVITDSGDQFLIPSTSTVVGNVITIAKTAPTIPKGLRSITIVCETDGLLFDGNCSDAYSPIATPYKLNVSPRSYIPVPDEVIWPIQ